jgi:hypothetical protein
MLRVETVEDTVARPRRAWRKPVFVAAFVAFAGVWAFGFWYDANRPAPEPLDTASVRAASTACRSASARLSALPPLPFPPELTRRIARVRREDAVFTDLVAEFRAIHPTNSEGAKALAGFATDWHDLTAARERYANELGAGKTRPDLVIPVDPTSAPITIRMKEYAQIHRLNVCTPDSLQGEVVEGVRTYPSSPTGAP